MTIPRVSAVNSYFVHLNFICVVKTIIGRYDKIMLSFMVTKFYTFFIINRFSYDKTTQL